MTFELIKLPYKYDSLEPFIDEETMRLHHDKHHQGYVDKLNKALEEHIALQGKPLNWLLAHTDQLPEDVKSAVINNGGGVINHDLFFSMLGKDSEPSGEILEEINKKFGNFDNFKSEFFETAATQFASGWTFLILNKENELEIIKTMNHGTPISEGEKPLLVIDVWEHAYYLKYKNERTKYIENFFNIINWEKVNKLFLEAKK